MLSFRAQAPTTAVAIWSFRQAVCFDEQAGSLMTGNIVGTLAPAAQSHISDVSSLQPARLICGTLDGLRALVRLQA